MLTVLGILILTILAPWCGAAGLIGMFVFHASFFTVWLVAFGLSVATTILIILGILFGAALGAFRA